MRLCRFDNDRLGLVEDDAVCDITAIVEKFGASRWPHPAGDPLITNLALVVQEIPRVRESARRVALRDVHLRSPVANPTKVMAAPANYRLHVEVDAKDPAIDLGFHRAQLEGVDAPTEKFGLFLKANSSLCGPSDGVALCMSDRRNDHEVELAVVIGRTCKSIPQERALEYVAGYCIGLDMTIRGVEDRSFRKSADTYTVLGPWLVTADDIPEPGNLQLALDVNGVSRQRSSTKALTVGIPRLLELASSMYTLYPGDILLTGTPEGVGAVTDGDLIVARCDGIGEMAVRVLSAAP